MANIKKMTHTATRTGIAYNRGMFSQIEIRFSKKYMIDKYGNKYNLKDGYPSGERFCTFILDINSIKEIVE